MGPHRGWGFGQQVRTSPTGGYAALWPRTGSKIPSPLLSPHPTRKRCVWGVLLFLSVISKTSETKQKCTPTRRSTVRLSPDFPPVWLIGASFPLSPPPLLSGFPAACRSRGCPYGSTLRCSKSSREGKKVKVSLNITTRTQAVTARHALFCTARVGKLGHVWMCKTG